METKITDLIKLKGKEHRVLRWVRREEELVAEVEPEDPFDHYLEIAAHLCVEIWNKRKTPVPQEFFGDKQDALPAMLCFEAVSVVHRLTGCLIADLNTLKTLEALAARLQDKKAFRPVGDLHRPRDYDVGVEVTRVERMSTLIDVRVKRAWSEGDAGIRASKIAQAKEGNINFDDEGFEDCDYERQVESIEPVNSWD